MPERRSSSPALAPTPAQTRASHRSQQKKDQARRSSLDPFLHASSASPKDSPSDLLTNMSTSRSMDSPKGPTATPSANPSVNTSTDPVTKPLPNLVTTPSMDPLVHAPPDSAAAGSKKRSTENPATATSSDVITDASKEPPVHPRVELMERNTNIYDPIPLRTLTMKPGQMPTEKWELNVYDMNVDRITSESGYLDVSDIAEAGLSFFYKTSSTIWLFDRCEKMHIDAGELVRFQQVLDEFGHADPQFPPDTMKLYFEAGLASTVFERVLNWAIVRNLTVDGDLRYTLLPRRIVELFRDLDHESTAENRIISRKWVRLTFGLLRGGLDCFRDSDQWVHGLSRIRDFVMKLLGPYFLERNEDGVSLYTFLTNILLEAITLGHHLLGHTSTYRWDWNWPYKVDKRSVLEGMEPAGLHEPISLVPGLVPSPALLKISSKDGTPLSEPATCVQAGSPISATCEIALMPDGFYLSETNPFARLD